MGDFSNIAARASAVGIWSYEYWSPTLVYRLQTERGWEVWMCRTEWTGWCVRACVSPVYYVTGAQQRRSINDRVPDGTRSVELWVLTNQMTRQETPVRTTNHGQAFGVQGDVCPQRSKHSPLREDTPVKSCDWLWLSSGTWLCVSRYLHIFYILASDLTNQGQNAVLTEPCGSSVIHCVDRHKKADWSELFFTQML